MFQPGQDLLGVQGSESEPCAPTLEGGDNFGEVVADEAEADVVGELLDDPPEGVLGVLGHGVGFVQDNQLEAGVKDGPSGRKVENLSSNHSDPAIIGGVQLQDHGVKFLNGKERKNGA